MKTSYCFMLLLLLLTAGLLACSGSSGELADPDKTILFSVMLWVCALIAGLISFAVFYLLHKNFKSHDYLWPLIILIVLAPMLLFGSLKLNLYGWFGGDCFNLDIVTDEREYANWAKPKQARPSECVEARENVSGLGINYATALIALITSDDRPLTTNAIKSIYSILLIIWSLVFYWLFRFVFRKLFS